MLESSDHGARGPGQHESRLAVHRDAGREQRRYREAQAVPDRVGHVRDRERDARQQADDAFGAEAQAVRAEPADARERAAREELDAEREQRDDQAHDQADVAVELVLHDVGGHRQRRRSRARARRENAPPSSPARRIDRAAADAADPAGGDRAPDLLLERQEHPGREHEDEHPQRVQRGVVGLAQPAEREDLEAVGRDAGDREAGADREGALGNHAPRPIDRDARVELALGSRRSSGAGMLPGGTWGVDTVSSRAPVGPQQ